MRKIARSHHSKGFSMKNFGFSVSLREESTGKLQSKTSVGVKYMLKLEHLQKLATWAGEEPSIASLGAFFGHHLASIGESMGVTPDPSLFSCERCETILQPGFNCNVRIEKSRSKARCRRRNNVGVTQNNVGVTQNNVVYRCHFCSHSNLLRGTPNAHMKEICPSNRKSSSTENLMEPCILDESIAKKIEVIEADPSKSMVDVETIFGTDVLGTLLVKQVTTLLDRSRRKRNKSVKKAVEPIHAASSVEKAAGSSSKRRRCWTSLEEIAQSSEHGNKRNIASLTIPFVL